MFSIMFSPLSWAYPTTGGSVSEDDTATVTAVAGHHCAIVNDGANEVFIQFEINSDEGAEATASDFELKNGETITLDTDMRFVQFLSICSAAETAVIRYICWD